MIINKMVHCTACEAPLAFLKQWEACFGVNSKEPQVCKGCEKEGIVLAKAEGRA